MRRRSGIFLALLLGFLRPAEGDVVCLKNGSRFEGVVIRRSPTEIELKIMLEGSMTFSLDQIEKLEIALPDRNLLIVEGWEQAKSAIGAPSGREETTAPSKGRPTRGTEPIRPAPPQPTRRDDAAQTQRLIRNGASDRSKEGNDLLALGKWRHRETRYFTVFHEDPAVGKDLASSADYYLEKILYDLNMTLESLPRRGKFETFAVSDTAVWGSLIEKRPQLEQSTAFSLAGKCEIFIRASSRTDEVGTFAHELSHLVLWIFSKGRALPLWVHEGFAMYESGQNRFAGKQVAAALKEGRLFSIEDLHGLTRYPMEEKAHLLFYMQSAKVVEYVITQHGRERFARFATLLAEGTSLSNALRQTFPGKEGTESGFQEAWLKYLAD